MTKNILPINYLDFWVMITFKNALWSSDTKSLYTSIPKITINLTQVYLWASPRNCWWGQVYFFININWRILPPPPPLRPILLTTEHSSLACYHEKWMWRKPRPTLITTTTINTKAENHHSPGRTDARRSGK